MIPHIFFIGSSENLVLHQNSISNNHLSVLCLHEGVLLENILIRRFSRCEYILIFQCLLKEFPKLFSERKELFVLKCWCCIVPVLGEVNDILFIMC